VAAARQRRAVRGGVRRVCGEPLAIDLGQAHRRDYGRGCDAALCTLRALEVLGIK
jgi:hypothetical protein